jgi:acyl-CoA thioesterase FadM
MENETEIMQHVFKMQYISFFLNLQNEFLAQIF